MKPFRLKLLVILLFFFSFSVFVFNSHPVSGQTFSLSLWPPILELMIQPGKTITQNYQIANLSDNPIQITCQLLTFAPLGEKGNVKFLTELPQNIFFTLDNKDLKMGQAFTLDAGKKKDVVLKIQVSEKAIEDDYYLTFLFASQTGSGITTGTSQTGVIGSHLLLTVSEDGQPPKKGEIISFRTKKVIDSLERPTFFLKVMNRSRTFFKPQGQIQVQGMLGQKFSLPLRPDNVLANSQREILTATDSASPKFLLGPYRVTVEFALEENGPTLKKTATFFAIPAKALIAIIISLILLGIIKSKEKFLPRRRNHS